MTRVEKVTVSLPPDLLARVEERRSRLGVSRSEVVVDLMWRGWRQIEQEAREVRYQAAYAVEVDTAEESSWADMAAEQLFAPASAARAAAPDPGPERRAAG